MVESQKTRTKKTGTKKTKSKKGIIITATILAPLSLTQKERKALRQSLRAAAETFVESLSKRELIAIECGDHK